MDIEAEPTRAAIIQAAEALSSLQSPVATSERADGTLNVARLLRNISLFREFTERITEVYIQSALVFENTQYVKTGAPIRKSSL